MFTLERCQPMGVMDVAVPVAGHQLHGTTSTSLRVPLRRRPTFGALPAVLIQPADAATLRDISTPVVNDGSIPGGPPTRYHRLACAEGCRHAGCMPRDLSQWEMAELLDRPVPCKLATVDADGYPHVTPLWFHWDGEVIRMTSLRGKPHLRRLRLNARVCVLVDVEGDERADGERPNRQVRLVGDAELSDDLDGWWTRCITERYLRGPSAERVTDRRAADRRMVIALRPRSVVAVASV